MTTPPDPITVALRVVDALEALGLICTVGGSIAASFAGEPRSTIDIDIVVALDADRVPDASRRSVTTSTWMSVRSSEPSGSTRALTSSITLLS